jgi:hypothetical protein
MRAMNRARTVTAILAATALLAGCGGPSYDESVQQCTKALKARHLDDKTKPKPCEPLKEDDYTLLIMSGVIDGLGWTDEDGRFDENKMLTSTPSP